MSAFSVTLPSGESWTPQFVQELNEDTCIGCGRCFKVCPRGVLELFGVNEDGDKLALTGDDDEDEEYEKKVMTIAHQELCIGCTACSKVCPKKCYTHGPVEA